MQARQARLPLRPGAAEHPDPLPGIEIEPRRRGDPVHGISWRHGTILRMRVSLARLAGRARDNGWACPDAGDPGGSAPPRAAGSVSWAVR